MSANGSLSQEGPSGEGEGGEGEGEGDGDGRFPSSSSIPSILYSKFF